MGLRQLAAFDAVASELHFGRAADRLGITQAAASQLVQRLEREHGLVLFERSSHHVALTAAGAALLEPARRALRAYDAFAETARSAAAGTQGRLRIATSEATAGPLATLLRGFRETYRDLEIELVNVRSDEKPRRILSGDLDLAFARSPLRVAGVHVEPLWTEPLLAVLPASTPHTDEAVVDPAELATLPLIIIDRALHPAMHDELVAEARRAGVEPRLGPPLIGGREGLAAVASGAGWTLVPASNAPMDLPQVRCLRFAPPTPTTTVSLLWRTTGASAATIGFARHAKTVARAGVLPATSR